MRRLHLVRLAASIGRAADEQVTDDRDDRQRDQRLECRVEPLARRVRVHEMPYTRRSKSCRRWSASPPPLSSAPTMALCEHPAACRTAAAPCNSATGRPGAAPDPGL